MLTLHSKEKAPAMQVIVEIILRIRGYLHKVNFHPLNKQPQLKLQNKVNQMGVMESKYTTCLGNNQSLDQK